MNDSPSTDDKSWFDPKRDPGQQYSANTLTVRLQQIRKQWLNLGEQQHRVLDNIILSAEHLEERLARSETAAIERSEILILLDVLNQARATLLVSIKGTPEDLQSSLGKLSLKCKAHWDWQTTRMPK